MKSLTFTNILPILANLHPECLLVVRAYQGATIDEYLPDILFFENETEYFRELRRRVSLPLHIPGEREDYWTKERTLLIFETPCEFRFITYKDEGFTDVFLPEDAKTIKLQLLTMLDTPPPLKFTPPPSPVITPPPLPSSVVPPPVTIPLPTLPPSDHQRNKYIRR